jgi:formamidopyrimidine-DNA glycosylase
MPELPDVTIYAEALERRIAGRKLEAIRLISPFVLRTAVPPISAALGKRVVGATRLGKRIVIELEGELFLVLHLMIAGRLRWQERGAKPPGRSTLATFSFETGLLVFTEAGTRRRASLHLVQGAAALAAFDRGGVELCDIDAAGFAARLASENHTLKRALTDPRLFSGIGNAYSDEILHRARLSPVALTHRLTADEIQRLYHATQDVLVEWVERLRSQAGEGFPEKVTAFRDGMAVHGRYGLPCPRCGKKIQRIRYASNETNYCPTCQTGGKLLADRALSRLLHQDWPRTLEELEALKQR